MMNNIKLLNNIARKFASKNKVDKAAIKARH